MTSRRTQTTNDQAAGLPRIGADRPVYRHNTAAKPRNRALAWFAGAAVLILSAPLLDQRFEHISASNIPSSEQNIDPAKYKIEAIPAEGAFDFAAQADPDHDPRNGVDQFQHQLGHTPEPGDVVAVPINAK